MDIVTLKVHCETHVYTDIDSDGVCGGYDCGVIGERDWRFCLQCMCLKAVHLNNLEINTVIYSSGTGALFDVVENMMLRTMIDDSRALFRPMQTWINHSVHEVLSSIGDIDENDEWTRYQLAATDMWSKKRLDDFISMLHWTTGEQVETTEAERLLRDGIQV